MTTPHVIASSSPHTGQSQNSSNGIVGSHYRVGKRIGEGSFGVVFEGIYSLLSTPIARYFPSLFVPTSHQSPDCRPHCYLMLIV
jgi:casein kinase 1